MREVMSAPEFQATMSTAELHYLLGKYLAAREDELGIRDSCILSTAYRCGVPAYVSSPGDSSIGLNMADLWLRERGPRVDVTKDINETSAIVYEAKKTGHRSAVVIFGGGTGSPYFTTDTAGALRAMEVGADVLIKATKVDAVYDDDPSTNPTAKPIDRLSYIDALNMRLRFMDSTALSLCMENNLPIVVLNLWTEGSIKRLLLGDPVGTEISGDHGSV